MVEVNVHDAKTHLSRLLQRVERGEQVIIARAGKPVATLVAIAEKPKRRIPGLDRGRVWIADDFDADLPEALLAEFEG